MDTMTRQPNGAAMAAIMAAGIGALVLGLLTTGAEASEGLKQLLTLREPVGPLSGKTTFSVVAYVLAWGVLHVACSGRALDAGKWLNVSWILIALGFLLTFPPVFLLFHGG